MSKQSELDDILEDFYDGDIRQSDMGKAKQAILDWHNKQVEEVLDRLCNDDKMYWDGACVNYLVRKSAIETERNKLEAEL